MLAATVAQGQINIHGNVYGGARQANVGGSTFVNVAADYHDVIINGVFGGNDIAGTIDSSKTMPITSPIVNTSTKAYVNNTFNAFIRIEPTYNKTSLTTKHNLFIGQLYGGGNGAYDYDSADSPYKGMVKPEIAKTYLEVQGGTIAYVFGGGNEATVKDSTVICIDNESDVVKALYDANDATNNLLTGDRLLEMKVNSAQTNLEGDFQFARVFGGNNVADMAIRPLWFLRKGSIRDLYSGGNEGRMTNPQGLLLEIHEGSDIVVDNIYGGCRKADVRPMLNNQDVAEVPNLDGYSFPPGLSARVLVRDGQIRNVYGGNDIKGRVYGGNAVGVYTSISGNVYGGGNGSYSYTDNDSLKNDLIYGDYYYEVPSGKTSVEALKDVRPNAEQVSIRVAGKVKVAENGDSIITPTRIFGSVYCGGNSASLKKAKANPKVELKIGSYSYIDNVFLGNNGEEMVDEEILAGYRGYVTGADNIIHKFSTMDLTEESQFATYMEGAAMDMVPSFVFDSKVKNDPADYKHFSSYIGSLFCGGNVGSMTYDSVNNMKFDAPVYIYNKVVGGCNNAYVPARPGLNAAYFGGIRGTAAEQANYTKDGKIRDRLIMNFDGLQIMPMKWNEDKTELVWNTIGTDEAVTPIPDGQTSMTCTEEDLKRRFTMGNVYAGCFESGQVNGNVIINIDSTLVDRNKIFDEVAEDSIGEAIYYNNYYNDVAYKITKRRSGVILGQQGMDVLGSALNVFGGGYGEHSEVWGSATINVNSGYVFQVFGGGEKGTIGKLWKADTKSFNESPTYDAKYSTCINLHGERVGVSKRSDSSPLMAECEFIYGGGFEGPILGDTRINLGNGRVFNTFAGSCNANILGHTETYIGSWPVTADSTATGFPWIRDHLYGGNDLGGEIKGNGAFAARVRDDDVKGMVYDNSLLTAASYVEYTQGRVDGIFGGAYGYYDYTKTTYSSRISTTSKPRMTNAFINIRPAATVESDSKNLIKKVYGAGQGYPSEPDKDKMQDYSYVLIDIPDSVKWYRGMEVFGGGAYGGVGMFVDKDIAATAPAGTAVIDLMHGQINAVYGGSHHEGFTRRTLVNVPDSSTIHLNSIFGGAYGDKITTTCDTYEAIVNFNGKKALVKNIYGGNNSARRTLYGKVNVNVPVYTGEVDSKTNTRYMATVYGGGFGKDTWSQYTEVNLNKGAMVYEVYGGGNAGKVINQKSLEAWQTQSDAVEMALPNGYAENGLENSLVESSVLGKKYNTNVHIKDSATVGNYAYGGGYGADAVVSGTTYIDLLGGRVTKDLYAAGTSGDVRDLFSAKNFVASANAYILGGTARNVYGGGWKGSVGYHDTLTVATTTDIPGETNVIIGKLDGNSFVNGIPAIQRNAYAGGEGGAVYGKAHLTLNQGYIGYTYDATEGYKEKLDDETWEVVEERPNRLYDCGNVFGGGYDDNSSVDESDVLILGGQIRGSLFGGGEIATMGRGETEESGEYNKVRVLKGVYKYGKTHVEMYNGHVSRNVFGGGKGYNVYGYGGVNRRYTDGYVFGQTEVFIHGGEIGTLAGVDEGYGNVFGGGDVGYVYGPGTADKSKTTGSPDHYYYYKDGDLTEDCRVVVEPYAQVKTKWKDITLAVNNDTNPDNDQEAAVTGVVTIGGHDYLPGQYVPLDTLNTLKGKNDISNIGSEVETASDAYTAGLLASDRAKWAKLDDTGIVIHNAVFGGGNVTSGSDKVYANATTVFGNVTVSLRDVYHRDLITVGYEHTGGLYGGGNLSLVDGYREVHIANYGTDYYGLQQTISLEEYYRLTDREKAYFRLRYTCLKSIPSYTDSDGIYHKAYNVGDPIYQEEYQDLADQYQTDEYWKSEGFCSIYAGRLLNTIQRADFCGVFGSRMVLMGARDRVTSVADYTRYTINRVGELSLNQQRTTAGDTEPANKLHGNYFGIYNVVNRLGNLTSDVRFDDPRTSDTNDADGNISYWQWKEAHSTSRVRNIGTSSNQVALASGVFLEMTTENSTEDHKDYGYITGIVELDLINAKADEVGGGYVYAKNEHGKRDSVETSIDHLILSPYNFDARTYKLYTYDENVLSPLQTSGNFIHDSKKRIIDDCYPHLAEYTPGTANYSEAHYWFVKGTIYIYDQYISAYTGSANSYSKTEQIPLTITPGSHGRLTLMNVQPNLYAYWNDATKNVSIAAGDSIKLDNSTKTFYLNDVISYWDYSQLNENDQTVFEKETKVSVAAYTLTETSTDTIQAGQVMLPSQYISFRNGLSSKTYQDGDKTVTVEHALYDVAKQKWVTADEIYRSSNNMSRENGYVLTFEMDSPSDWDKWYSPVNRNYNSGNMINTPAYAELATAADSAKYLQGPTFHSTASETKPYGQRMYQSGEIIPESVVSNYPTQLTGQDGQAVVVRAYAPKYAVEYSYTDGDEKYSGTLYPGSPISATLYGKLNNDVKAKLEEAQVCTHTLKLAENSYLFLGDIVTSVQIDSLAHVYQEAHLGDEKLATTSKEDSIAYAKNLIANYLANAYYCDTEGLYGGKLYDNTQNFSPIESWCVLSAKDRQSFEFNQDAFDLLTDPEFRGRTTGADGGLNDKGELYRYGEPYCQTYSVEYEAVYQGDKPITFTKEIDDNTTETVTVTKEEGHNTLSNTDYEKYIANEQYHFTPIRVTKTPSDLVSDGGEDYYIVKKRFVRADIPYEVGQVIEASVYRALNAQERTEYVTVQKFLNNTEDENHYEYYFFCREDFVVGEKGGYDENSTITITDCIDTSKTYTKGQTIPKGTFISKEDYQKLPNQQKAFLIKGMEPTETATLYVSRESDINDLTKERIYTVIYQYTYNESDDTGDNVELVNELHVINVHVQFESGVPSVGTLTAPPTVLPGETVGLSEPRPIVPGAYEIIGGGWEIFDNKADAENHRNGQPYKPNETRMYWYQNQKHYVAYYAETYLGKTYSNSVPFSVANYHDLGEVMADKTHHMYVDYDPAKLDRDCKIYVNDAQNGLSQLSDFINLSYGNSSKPEGHSPLNSDVAGGANLEFFLRTDLSHDNTEWTPLASLSGECFSGVLHGDGHTVSGLSNSLIHELCGQVYNLGVTGTFTGAGVADTGEGYVENCWVKSRAATVDANVRAVFGNPSRTGTDLVQVVNCYYPESNQYKSTAVDDDHGSPTQKPDKAFYNGEVAYNLNGFYLYKRYSDQQNVTSGKESKYYTVGEDNTLSAPQTKLYASGDDRYCSAGYVENRYSDGDFIYAEGEIPADADERRYMDPATSNFAYYPIWPDDYLYFGQKLDYGYGDAAHQDEPSFVNKKSGRLVSGDGANRVFRAPAYYRSADMSAAHFNADAVFAKTKANDAEVIAYKDLTAIDFTGYNDAGYAKGNSGGKFYPPLLDDNGLTSFQNVDLTQNLLVYTGTASTAAALTSQAVGKLPYETYSETNSDYHTVDYRDPNAIRGHWVQEKRDKNGNVTGYEAGNDHLLVDKNDFFAPIAYNFATGKRMWYQREPDLFVDKTKGWEGVSLPFTADIVTTQKKGELTHFYAGSTTGHEYWLRQYKGEDKDAINVPTGVYAADMSYPAAGGTDKTVTNTFLWDYYYQGRHNHLDMREDEYQTYYKDARTYGQYPRLAAGTAYLIGFPGPTYYEFDLSGGWSALTTDEEQPDAVKAQVITFASAAGASIGVSSDEATPEDGFTFHPNYLNRAFVAGTANTYTLSADGSSYDKVPAAAAEGQPAVADTEVAAFRPYFTGSPTNARTRGIDQIIFSQHDDSLVQKDNDPGKGEVGGGLSIYAKRKKIVVESSLGYTVDVRIVNMAGITLNAFTIEPGETVETRVNVSGVYIVETTDSRYTKKLTVK